MSEFSVLGDFFRVFSQIKESYPIFLCFVFLRTFHGNEYPSKRCRGHSRVPLR